MSVKGPCWRSASRSARCFGSIRPMSSCRLDADLLGTHPNHTRYANDWSQKRRSADTDKTMSRVHVAESTFSLTGSVADARLGVAPGRIYALVRAIAGRLGSIGIPVFEEWDEKHWSGEILPADCPATAAASTD